MGAFQRFGNPVVSVSKIKYIGVLRKFLRILKVLNLHAF